MEADFSELTPQEDFVEIDAGSYPATVYEVEEKTSEASGARMLFVKFRISGGEYEGRMVKNNYMMSGKGAFRTQNLLIALGKLADDSAVHFSFDPPDLLGMPLEVDVDPPQEGKWAKAMQGVSGERVLEGVPF